LSDYGAAPWTVLAFWQGGFAPWWGVAIGAVGTAIEAWRHPAVMRGAPAIAIGALAAWWLPAGLLTPGPAASGVVMPTMTLTTLAGEPVALAGTGTPTVVNVWATWCPPCRRELPLLVSAAGSSPDVRILLVNQGEGAEAVQRYLDAVGLAADGVLLDGRGALASALRVAGLPTTFAFDAGGRLVDLHVGELSAAALRGLIERAR
jgi:thiol-disulfide isomerase/thioredoxin